MQAAGMLRGTRAVYLLVSLISLIGYAHPFPLQLLPSIPGYIPVYIRHGDQPLEEINPALAEAFHEGPSLPKSIRLDNIPGPTVISIQEDEASLGDSKEKSVSGVHVRDVEGSTPDIKDKKVNKPTEKSPETETPKLLTIYELHDDDDGSTDSRREKFMKKENSGKPMDKVAPLTAEEKETLEKLMIQVANEDSGPNDRRDSDSNTPELPSKEAAKQNNIQNYGSILKLEQMITDDPTELPGLRLIKDLPQISADEEIPESLIKDEDVPETPIKDEEPPVKDQRPANVLANVGKLSPIALPENNTHGESTSKEAIVESRQDEKSKDLTEQNDGASTY